MALATINYHTQSVVTIRVIIQSGAPIERFTLRLCCSTTQASELNDILAPRLATTGSRGLVEGNVDVVKRYFGVGNRAKMELTTVQLAWKVAREHPLITDGCD